MKLLLFHPVKPRYNQLFGENANNFYAQLGMTGHNGIDYFAPRGTPVYAAHSGVALKPQTEVTKGLAVYIKTHQPFYFSGGNYYATTVYFHLLGINVKEGDRVRVGDLIGWADNTGKYTTGDHLHFGLKPTSSNGVTLFTSNGYGGYVDPLPYMSTLEATAAAPMLVRISEALAVLAEKVADLLRKKNV